MKRCIDTCAYSRLMRGDDTMRRWLEDCQTLIVPTIVLGELYTGFLSGSKHTENIRQFERFLALPDIHIQEITSSIALRYALLVQELRKAGTPIPTNDIWIAATAQDAGASLISCDRHFHKISGLLINW